VAERSESNVDIAAERGASVPFESTASAEKLLGPSNVKDEEDTAGWAGRTEYGPVKRGETLWEIVKQLRADKNLTPQQVMLALLKTNRDAFINDNVNNLKTGKILKIPERSSVESIAPVQALKEFRAQYDVWQEYKLKLAGVAKATNVAAVVTVEKNSSKGQITAEKPSKEPPPAANDKKIATAPPPEKEIGIEDLLKIVRANLDKPTDAQKKSGKENKKENKETATGAAKTAVAERRSLQDKVAVLEEAIESKEMENKELRERVNQIEIQLKNAKRLIELENKQLAQAQKQASGNKTDLAPVNPDNSKSKESSKPAAAGATPEAGKPPAKSSGPKQTTAAPSPAQKPAATEKTGMQSVEDSLQTAKTLFEAGLQTAKTLFEDGLRTAKPLFESSLRTAKTLWNDLLADKTNLSLVGGGIGVVASMLLLVYWRRRRHSIAEFEESILSGGGLNSEGNMSDTARSENVDASFLSDFSQGGMGNIHTDEVDPIAEAEVYLAYGRDEQAEEILKEAVVKDPGRHELRQKLLEIYHQRNDLASFETVAEELYAALEGKGGKIWQKVEEMGKKMNPQNPLFRGGKPARVTAGEKQPLASLAMGGAGGANAPEPTALDQGLSFNLDSPAAGTAAASSELSFDLDFSTSSTETAAGSGSIDFPAAAQHDAGHGSPAPPSPGIDLDFSVLATEPSASDEPALSGGIDFEASITSSEDVGLSFDVDSPATASNGSNEIAWGMDSAPVTPDGVAFESVGELGEDSDIDNSQVDEAATKLDLAKAYIDMGDAEGARSILDEVLVEGNEKQKKQAAELAAQIT
jgi:pilus assembly protein FimV